MRDGAAVDVDVEGRNGGCCLEAGADGEGRVRV